MTRQTRLEQRVHRDFPEPGSALDVLRLLNELPDLAGYDRDHFRSERIRAAVILIADGDTDRLHQAIDLAKADWRDLLMAADLGHADWPARLDAELGPEDPDLRGRVTV